MLHNVVIKQRKVYLKNRDFVQGGINADEISVFPDLEWEDCDTILVNFENENVEKTETRLVQPGTPLLIPKSMLEKAGLLYFSFTGYVGDTKRITTEHMTHVRCGKVHLAGVIAEEGSASHPDELDYLASLIKEVQDIKEWLEEGGMGGTMDYTKLNNLPSIEDISLIGNHNLSDFGLAALTDNDINSVLT